MQAKRPYSLAVMSIEVASGNEDQRYLAEGVTEELIFELGRFKKLFVTSRSATRALAATACDPQTVGDRFGVRYVLTGTIRQLGSQIRLSLSLSETETGGVVWSDRRNESFESLVDRLDELVSRVASTVLGRIEESDIVAARRLKPESMTAYEFYLRGLEYHRLGGVLDENLRQATRWFERAIEADANFARPRAMWVCARSALPEFDWDDGERRTQRALELDPNDPEANRIMGSILMHRGAFDASRKYHEKAMALSPSDAYVKGRSAAFYNFSGEPERALQLLDEAGELDPFLHVWCVEERVAVLYHLGRFREAIEAALRLTFQTRRSRLYRAAAHAALGETARAREVVAEAIASAPDLTTDFVENHEWYRDTPIKRTLIEFAGSRRSARASCGTSSGLTATKQHCLYLKPSRYRFDGSLVGAPCVYSGFIANVPDLPRAPKHGGGCEVPSGSFATETRCPSYVRLSPNLRHDFATKQTSKRANSETHASQQDSFVLMTGTSGRSGDIPPEHLRGPELVTLQLDGGSSSIHGEFRALNETSAIRRKEDNGFSNLVGCGWTPRWCLRANRSRPSPIESVPSVRVGPGLTALMRTPLRPYSAVHAFVSKLIAALLDP